MIPLEEALGEVLAACRGGPAARVDVASALGLVLAEEIVAPEAVPPFLNTAMDGYALRASDVCEATPERPARLRVVGTLGAGGVAERPVGPGEALKIMTGALFPDGADAVAIVETTTPDGDHVLVRAPARAGDHLRHPGEDVERGQVVFSPGTALGPGHLGVLSGIGCEKVLAHPAPVVGVLSTGDELVEGGGPLAPGQIRDSNRRTLVSLLRRDGFGVVDLGIARDDEAEIESRVAAGARRCDALITSGGVSMGEFDYVKAALERMGRMRWMQVAIRPAKPFAFGVVGGVPVFGLPGNPVSSTVSYEILARPGLRRIAGRPDPELHRVPLRAVVDGDALSGAGDGRTTYARVRAGFREDGRVHVTTAGAQGSHQLLAMARANALAVLPPGTQAEPGREVDVILLEP